MRWFCVWRTEYTGYDCGGHRYMSIVAANDEDEALKVVRNPSDIPFDDPRVVPFELPSLSRKKKPFEYTPCEGLKSERSEYKPKSQVNEG